MGGERSSPQRFWASGNEARKSVWSLTIFATAVYRMSKFLHFGNLMQVVLLRFLLFVNKFRWWIWKVEHERKRSKKNGKAKTEEKTILCVEHSYQYFCMHCCSFEFWIIVAMLQCAFTWKVTSHSTPFWTFSSKEYILKVIFYTYTYFRVLYVLKMNTGKQSNAGARKQKWKWIEMGSFDVRSMQSES